MMDMDFVEMLEYRMPPACGWGNSFPIMKTREE